MRHPLLPSLAALLLAACNSSGDAPMVSLGLDDAYFVDRMQKLPLRPALGGASCRWTVDGRLVATTPDYVFVGAAPGVYHLTYTVDDPANPLSFAFTVTVLQEEVAYSPYLAEVVEYCPAPGQFVNTMPEWAEGDDYAAMLQKCTASLTGTNDGLVTLGAWGGYLTFRFDHTVANLPGEPDFRLWGNSFAETMADGRTGGSAEPGTVWVSLDNNCDGLPNDPWYELRGSAFDHPLTRRGHAMTYRRPAAETSGAEPADGYIALADYIGWTDSQGQSGWLEKNTFHTQSYWPQWLPADQRELSFEGTLLPPNAVDTSGAGSHYVLYCFDWGYADNHPNSNAALNSFDISNAVDADGLPVDLPGADFVRVVTGVSQYCRWIGETSTELSRACDLHLLD